MQPLSYAHELDKTEGAILTFQLLTLIFKLTVDFKTVLKLAFHQFELLFGERILINQIFVLCLDFLKLSQLHRQVVNFDGHFCLSFILIWPRC